MEQNWILVGGQSTRENNQPRLIWYYSFSLGRDSWLAGWLAGSDHQLLAISPDK